jgi:hypothetical protein
MVIGRRATRRIGRNIDRRVVSRGPARFPPHRIAIDLGNGSSIPDLLEIDGSPVPGGAVQGGPVLTASTDRVQFGCAVSRLRPLLPGRR